MLINHLKDPTVINESFFSQRANCATDRIDGYYALDLIT